MSIEGAGRTPRGPRAAALVVLALILALAGASSGQEPSLAVLSDWKYYNNVGWQALDRGNLDRAAQAFRMAIEIMRPYESTSRGLLARSYADFSKVLVLQKRYDEAEPMARWALTVRESAPGDRSEALTQSLDLLAQIHRARGRPAEAEPLLKRELEVQRKELGPAHPDLIPTVEALADLYAQQGRVADAEPLYRRALSLREQNSARNIQQAERLEQSAFILRQIGGTETTLGGMNVNQMIQAERLETRAQSLRATSAESVNMAVTAEGYATLLRRAGRVDEADNLDARARAIRDAAESRAARDRIGR